MISVHANSKGSLQYRLCAKLVTVCHEVTASHLTKLAVKCVRVVPTYDSL